MTQKDYLYNNIGIDVDVGFSDLHQCSDDNSCNKAKKTTLILPYLSYQDQLKSKYLIVVDGNSWAFRFSNFLSTNSLVLYNGIYTFWYSRHLKPYVHYLPFKPDFSDLTSQLEYAKNHDDEMKKSASNARAFAEKYLRRNVGECYLGLLLIEYADLLKHLG